MFLMRQRSAYIALGLALLGRAVLAMEPDAPGSADHQMVGRFKGSVIKAQTQQEFDRYVLPLGPADKSETRFQQQQEIEGRVTKTLYEAPTGSSPLAVFRGYQVALQQVGFTTMFTCAAKQCSPDGRIQYAIKNTRPADYIRDLGGRSFDDEDAYLLVAHEPRKDVYAVVYATHIYGDPTHVVYLTDVVESKALANGSVAVVDAKTMADDIGKVGHVALYGIYFDTAKATLNPESSAALNEIARLLKMDPALKLHVVGHTDNVGTLAANMTLAKQRADAVVSALTTEYHIASGRLIGNGVGPLAPVASNSSEDGRAKNRRVELVPQ
jgi:outer membrane protein OmpA-like peptidoglycan-associated protein